MDMLDTEDPRRRHARFRHEYFEHYRRFAEGLERIAASRDCTPVRLALAWLLAKLRL